ncbi:MAG: hypothetical protein K0U21_04825 [Proteobacteria bacterium]|nr:hypothetical protein [Pseudomonadota bacterium]
MPHTDLNYCESGACLKTKMMLSYATGNAIAPFKEREIMISERGIALHVDDDFQEHAATMIINFKCPNGQEYSVHSRYLKHLLGMKGWMAFEFERGDESFFAGLSAYIRAEGVRESV